jgi:hypothetical protein
MLLLAVQIANNVSDENPILIIGLTAFVVSAVLLLWKNEAKSNF